MAPEQKDILLKDLCARLPYGVMAKFGDSNPSKITNITQDIDSDSWFVESEGEFDVMTGEFDGMMCEINNIKPYLFPMSSMDLDQRIEYSRTLVIFDESHCSQISETYDWLNKNHFDYRDLIPKGLAINAIGLNIY